MLISPELSGHQTRGILQQRECPVQIINQIGPVQIIDPVLNIYSHTQQNLHFFLKGQSI